MSFEFPGGVLSLKLSIKIYLEVVLEAVFEFVLEVVYEFVLEDVLEVFLEVVLKVVIKVCEITQFYAYGKLQGKPPCNKIKMILDGWGEGEFL